MIDPVNIFWFRRDLRLEDNVGLLHALTSGNPLLPLFIFDKQILESLDRDDARLSFLYKHLKLLNEQFKEKGSGLVVKHGDPEEVWKDILNEFKVERVFTNDDYEPYARERDAGVKALLNSRNIEFTTFKDHVIFEKDEVVKKDGLPYSVYTSYANKWLEKYNPSDHQPVPSQSHLHKLCKFKSLPFPSLKELGFHESDVLVPEFDISDLTLDEYNKKRNFPAVSGTSKIGPYLRFGIIGIRSLVAIAFKHELTFLKELIWREFFMQVLYHHPRVVRQSFKKQYDRIEWRNNEQEFEKWCQGQTGYPLVDAGMRELKASGSMHNRVRMITASFLCKHLLIDWRWGEAWFARYLLDYELASNNGNWQWAAGTGCDAAPYFRVFNPETQQKKFDAKAEYVKKWIPEYGSRDYPEPMNDHKFARNRAIGTYKSALSV